MYCSQRRGLLTDRQNITLGNNYSWAPHNYAKLPFSVLINILFFQLKLIPRHQHLWASIWNCMQEQSDTLALSFDECPLSYHHCREECIHRWFNHNLSACLEASCSTIIFKCCRPSAQKETLLLINTSTMMTGLSLRNLHQCLAMWDTLYTSYYLHFCATWTKQRCSKSRSYSRRHFAIWVQQDSWRPILPSLFSTSWPISLIWSTHLPCTRHLVPGGWGTHITLCFSDVFLPLLCF